MHFSAKGSLAIACRLSVYPSVRLSVTLVDFDHTGWNSSKIISLLLSEMCSLSADPNIMDLVLLLKDLMGLSNGGQWRNVNEEE